MNDLMPHDFNDVELAFPAHALDHMPAYEDVPDKYKDSNEREWYARVWAQLMFGGLDDIQLSPADSSWTGGDVRRAWRHLNVILRSFAPKHEHKMAALAYLTDTWFAAVRWKPRDKDEWEGTPDVEWPDEVKAF